jgi:ornithine cyclodeaminase/alanine dehydrogenase-like protein (mu-crystallin family)
MTWRIKNHKGIVMRYFDFDTIKTMNIPPKLCLNWAREIFLNKHNFVLPPKISIKFNDGCFFNTMPSLLPELNRYGVKIVSRYPPPLNDIYTQDKIRPSISADIFLYDVNNGELVAIMDGTWITAMRTGAVAAISINLLKKKNTNSYSFIGLGNTARTTLLCLNEILNYEPFVVKILSYKDQHTTFMKRFSLYNNIIFEVYNSVKDLIKSSDVVISCVTVVKQDFALDTDYSEGILIVPVHTMGFQNCDLFFDKVFCDDIGHIENFKYFNHFKKCNEISNILLGNCSGREFESERILVYNIGLSIFDIMFASNIYNMADKQGILLSTSKIMRSWV